MARKIRIEHAGAAYHVMARGNQGRDIYADERDRKLWLAAPARQLLRDDTVGPLKTGKWREVPFFPSSIFLSL
jgi:hypothetical protein